MKANEGMIDRAVRFILGAALIAVALLALNVMDGAILGIVAAAVGAVLVITGLAGYCPAYKICGLSTCAPKGAPDA